MIALDPFLCGRGQQWSARLGHEADATARGTGMATPLPGDAVPAVSAAVPPRPGEERPPQLPVRAKAALTISDSKAVFRVRIDDGALHLRFLGATHRIAVVEARES